MYESNQISLAELTKCLQMRPQAAGHSPGSPWRQHSAAPMRLRWVFRWLPKCYPSDALDCSCSWRLAWRPDMSPVDGRAFCFADVVDAVDSVDSVDSVDCCCCCYSFSYCSCCCCQQRPCLPCCCAVCSACCCSCC